MRQPAIFRVGRGIEGNQRTDQIGITAGDRFDEGAAVLVAEGNTARTVEEQLVVLADPHHVIIAGDQPEGIMDLVIHHFHNRRFAAQAIKPVKHGIPIDIIGRIDDRLRVRAG